MIGLQNQAIVWVEMEARFSMANNVVRGLFNR